MKKILSFLVYMSFGLSVFGMGACSASKKAARHHQDLQTIYDVVKQAIPEGKVTFEKEEIKIILPEALMFDVNSAVIHESYKPTISRIAKILKDYEKTSILITGYTDISGNAEANDKLSLERAESAKAVLINNNVTDNRIYTWGLGSRNPIASNETADGRKQNRRVEFVILYDYQDNTKVDQ